MSFTLIFFVFHKADTPLTENQELIYFNWHPFWDG